MLICFVPVMNRVEYCFLVSFMLTRCKTVSNSSNFIMFFHPFEGCVLKVEEDILTDITEI